MPTDTPWWGPLKITAKGTWSGRLGPFEMWVRDAPGEVHVATLVSDDPLSSARGRARQPSAPEEATHRRFVTDATPLSIAPALADRPVVVRPEHPLHVPPGSTAELLISTPLWLRLTAGESGQLLLDVPTYRPSDTWFGPSPREGELCYASRTRARLRATAEGTWRARAHTVLSIENRGSDSLLVARIALPVPRLGLYAGGTGAALWTESLAFRRHSGEGLAEVTIEPGAPAGLAGGYAVAGPRAHGSRNVFARAVSSLLG